MIEQIRFVYPNAKIVINGVMSRDDSSHARRRAVDAVIGAAAKSMCVPFISLSGWGTPYANYYWDNVHLTQQGHNLIAQKYRSTLATALIGRCG